VNARFEQPGPSKEGIAGFAMIPPSIALMHMRWVLSLTICTPLIGCGPTTQPESAKTVAAFEVPLSSEADRANFIAVLRAAAAPEGMHVDAESSEDLKAETKVSPNFEMTMKAAVWRGSDDDEAVASAMDQFDHLGRVWIMFSRGKNPTLTGRFRENAMREIMLRWPGTLSLPIMPTGAVPLIQDLVRTPNGHVVNPSAAHKYELRDHG